MAAIKQTIKHIEIEGGLSYDAMNNHEVSAIILFYESV